MLNSPRLLNLPLLLLANKQDNPHSLSVSEIRESFEAWQRAQPGKPGPSESAPLQRDNSGASDEGHGVSWDDGGAKEERMASLDVMGVSALEG